jgi:hypothetical protein
VYYPGPNRSEAVTDEQLRASFAKRAIDSDTFLLGESYRLCDGIPVRLEHWAAERVHGHSVVIPRVYHEGKSDDEIIAWARLHLAIGEPAALIVGREYFFIDHSLVAAGPAWQSAFML